MPGHITNDDSETPVFHRDKVVEISARTLSRLIPAEEVEAFTLEQGASLDESLVSTMEEEGMEVNEVDTDAFVEGSRGIYEKFAAEVEGGEELLSRVEALRE